MPLQVKNDQLFRLCWNGTMTWTCVICQWKLRVSISILFEIRSCLMRSPTAPSYVQKYLPNYTVWPFDLPDCGYSSYRTLNVYEDIRKANLPFSLCHKSWCFLRFASWSYHSSYFRQLGQQYNEPRRFIRISLPLEIIQWVSYIYWLSPSRLLTFCLHAFKQWVAMIYAIFMPLSTSTSGFCALLW